MNKEGVVAVTIIHTDGEATTVVMIADCDEFAVGYAILCSQDEIKAKGMKSVFTTWQDEDDLMSLAERLTESKEEAKT